MASTIRVDNVQNTPGTNIASKCGTTITLGACGDTVSLASGASQTGFGRTGTVDWDTASIKTAEFTAVSGNGYFVNTTGGTVKVNLPAGSAGDIVGLKDYANTWDSNAITIAPNGSDNIGGDNATDPTVGNEGGALLLVYVDGTQGWLTTQQSVTTSPSGTEVFMVATGGTPCAGQTSGDYKYHTFTGPGTFCVSQVAGTAGENVVSYLVVAGGGGAICGGAGGGGFREYKNSCDPYTASPLDGNPCGTAITVTATGYPITVGAGGPGHPGKASGADSIFSSITSAGGGYAGAGSPGVGIAGGSGGGSTTTTGGAGNTPPVTPPQGNPGGTATTYSSGGGGATTAGGNYPGPHIGGTGATTCITASPVGYAGGGGGASPGGGSVARPPCGSGGAGIAGAQAVPGTQCGIVNRGGGAGGVYCGVQGSGGSGVVIIRYKFQ